MEAAANAPALTLTPALAADTVLAPIRSYESTFAVFRAQASDSERLCQRLAVPEAYTGWG